MVNIGIYFLWGRGARLYCFLGKEEAGFLSGKFKALVGSGYHRVQYFFAGTSYMFSACQCLQGVFGIFFVLFGS